MLTRVLNAPINLYFDVTPIGRVLNRFSKDLQKVETDLSYVLGSTMACFYITIATLIVACIAVPWILFILPLFTYAIVKVYVYSIQAFRETTRLGMVAKSPILS